MTTVTLSSFTPTFVKAVFNGNNGAGSISVPGLQVGDVALVFANGNFLGAFESVISVADQIQQTSGNNLSSITLTLVLIRWS